MATTVERVCVPDPGSCTRAITFPIREVVECPPDVLAALGTLPDKRTHPTPVDVFRRAWRLSTDLANWAQQELALRDVRRTPDMEEFPPYDPAAMFPGKLRTSPRKATEAQPAANGRPARKAQPAKEVGEPQPGSLYDLWTRAAPADLRGEAFAGCAVAARDVLTAVEKTWKVHRSFGRFAVLWKGEASACVLGYPQPWPVPADKGKTLRISLGDYPEASAEPAPARERGETQKAFRARLTAAQDARRRLREAHNAPLVSLPVPGGRVLLRLANDHGYRQQLADFWGLLKDPTRLRQAKVVGRWKAGKLVGADVKIVATFPAKPPRSREKSCLIRTDPNALLVCEFEGRTRPSIFNADDVKRRLVAHRNHKVRLQRIAEDLKHEKRVPRERRLGVNGHLERVCAAHANYMRTAVQQLAAQVVGLCDRLGVGTVVYDDTDRGFLGTPEHTLPGDPPRPLGFPWHALRSRIADSLRSLGIEVHAVTPTAAEEDELGPC